MDDLKNLNQQQLIEIVTDRTLGANKNKRYHAAIILGQRGPDALPALVDLLHQEHKHLTRINWRAIIYNLALDGLYTLLNDHPDQAAPVVESLLDLLSSGNVEQRKAALSGINRIGRDHLPHRKKVTEALQTTLQDDDHTVRNSAMEALGRWGESDVLPLMLNTLQAGNLIGSTLHALSTLGDPAALSVLAGLWDNPAFIRYRLDIIRTQGRIGGREALPGLIAALNSDDPVIRGHVASYLTRIAQVAADTALTRQIVSKLIPLLADDEHIHIPELQLMQPRLHIAFPGARMEGRTVAEVAAEMLGILDTPEAQAALKQPPG